MLLDIAKASTALAGSWGGYSPQDRIRLVNEIINQQSNDIQEVKDNPPIPLRFEVPQD